MEYLLVTFPRKRRVVIDEEFNGTTGEVIEVEGGPHTVTLGPPKNFKPKSRAIDISNTSALMPLTVAFEDR